MDVPSVLSQVPEIDSGSGSRVHESPGDCATGLLSVGAYERRNCPEIQLDAIPEESGGNSRCEAPGHVHPRNLPAGRTGQRNASDSVHADWQLHVAASGHIAKTGNPQALSSSGSAGSTGLRPLEPVGHAAVNDSPNLNVCSPPTFSLHNPGTIAMP